jgi:hypothetical protein
LKSATIPLMPRGSYLFCFAKKGNPKKAESVGDDWPDPAMLRKKRNEKKIDSLILLRQKR